MSDTNEHDITKGMLSVIRKANQLNEEENDSISLSGEEKKEEESKIKQAVGPRISFEDNSINIYPYDNNVILRGQFDDGLMFEMSKLDGLYITASSLQLNNNDAVEMIQKLKGYYDVWVGEWSDKIQDYKKDLK